MRYYALIVAPLLVIAGCKTPEEGVVGKPPAEDELAAKPRPQTQQEKEPERPKYPDPGLVLPTSPYVEERKSFVLTWQGGDRAVPLHREPDPNSEILGEVVWDDGERILWQNTVVAVYEPKVVRASEEWLAEGMTYSTGYVTDPEFVSETIGKGQPLEIWGYVGGMQCILGVASKIIEGRCPPKESFAGAFQGKIPAEWYQPARRVWWVQITGDNLTGWFPVDDRFVVDIVDQ